MWGERHIMDRFYVADRVNDHLTTLKSASGEFVFLLEGAHEALLIDTCLGVGNLRAQVEELTALPVTVALTHGHLDHAMGAPEWEGSWMNPLDVDVYRGMCSVEDRRGYLAANAGDACAAQWEESFLPAEPDYAFRPLVDGQTFDLGGVTVEAVAFPGHTPGCTAMLLVEDRILITGDACNVATFLFDETASSVAEYCTTVERVAERLAGRHDRVFMQHHVMDAVPNLLQEMLDVCDRVLAGTDDAIPMRMMGRDARLAMEANKTMQRVDGGCANLFYNPEHLRQDATEAKGWSNEANLT